MKTNKLISILVLAIALLLSQNAFAQMKVSGKVLDANGDPVIGAVVMLQGSTSVGTTTDVDGNYAITLPADAKSPKLFVSCMGYSDQTVDVAGRGVINFELKDDLQLEEVVVVGYGSVRKSDLTGSVSAVRIQENEAVKAASIATLLQGHAAGVQVTNNGGSPDGGVSIHIRGTSSLNGSNQPLYVVDGIILNTSSSITESMFSSSTAGLDSSDGNEETNGLMGLNPQDIESMEILKDASATAIYGALGANGVVLITTKKATSDKPVIRFSAGVDISTRYKKLEMLDFDEYVDFEKYRYEVLGLAGAQSVLKQIYYDYRNYSGMKINPVDWQDYVMRTAVSQRYYFNISGKPGSTSYNFSLGYNNQNGIIQNTNSTQYTMRLNVDKTVGKKFSFGIKSNLAYINSNLTAATGSGRLSENTSLIRSMISYQPYLMRSEGDAEGSDEDDEFNIRANPSYWASTDHFLNSRKEYRITPSLYAEYKILPELVFRSMVGADIRNSERYNFKSEYLNSEGSRNIAARANVIYFNWNWDNTLNYMKQLGDHHITATLGTTLYNTNNYTQKITAWEIPTYKLGIEGLNSVDSSKSTTSYSESASQTFSYFARAVYSFKDRYVLTATFRADGSSKFQGANKWAYFPSGAFAWRITQEPWFNVNFISNAKLRIGWGRVGNQAISNYQTMTNYGSVQYAEHIPGAASDYVVGLKTDNLANPNLKWETTEQTNIGLDLSFWQGRLSFSADAYVKMTYDLLQKRDIPISSGFSSIWMNEGTIRNRGLEFTLDVTPVSTRNFEWTLDGNISFNRNTLVSINSDAQTYGIWTSIDKCEDVVYYLGSDAAASYCKAPLNIFMEGYPIGLFYGYKVKGIVQEGETGIAMAQGGTGRGAGYLDYYDLNGNGYLDIDDRTIIGDPNPDFTYGFGSTFRYKNFSLNLMFNGVYGNDIFYLDLCKDTDTAGCGSRNIRKSVWYDYWTPENTDAKYPAIGSMEAADYSVVSDFYVEDGSYLRLSDVSLSYNLPLKNSKSPLKAVDFTLSAKNLKVWTAYSGWDPDVNSFGSSTTKIGIDSGSYPTARTFSFDVKFTF